MPGVALRAALGEFADSLTTGQRAIPAKISAHGYQFQFPTSDVALRALVG